MLWVLKRTVSMRRFFWAPKTYAKNYGKENIYNFTSSTGLPLFLYWLLFSRKLLAKSIADFDSPK